MNWLKLAVTCGCLAFFLGNATLAADTPAKKQTCCEKAAAEGKECTHKCCIAAHKAGKSCEKCNPSKEDLKISKKKADKRAQK